MEVVLKDATSAKKRLTNSGKNDMKDPNLDVHGVRSSSKSGIIFKGFENPKVSVCEELATAERQTAFVNNRLSNGTNNYVNNPRKILCGEDVGKSLINGLSSKTIVIHATGIKKDSSLSLGGNYESSLDIQKVKEVNCHSVDQSLEAMRKKIASYISYSGSEESSSSDSEVLDFNDQKKDGCQMNRIIRNRGGEMSPKCVHSSKSLQGIENAVADRNSEVEKESTFSVDARKFSMKWNITAKKVDSVNSLTSAREIWDDALIISHTERRSLNECELRHSLKLDSNSPKGMKTSEGNCENDGDKRDFFHGQNEKETFSINDAANRCISDKRMTSEHDSSWNDSNYSEKAQENTKLHDECSRGEYEQKPEGSREISFHNLKEKNRNYVGSQEKPLKDEETRTCDSPRQTISLTTNKRIKNTNANNNLRLGSSFSEKSSKNQKSRSTTYKSSIPGNGIFEDPGSFISTDANASPVRRSPEHKQLVFLAEERKSEQLNSVTKSSSSDKHTKNLIARKQESTGSGLKTLDESMTYTNKEKVYDDFKYQNRAAEYNDATSKQTTLGRRKPFKNNDDKETRNDDEKLSISNRRRSRQSISLEKECRQRKFRESTSLERESKYGKQLCFDNECDDERKSSSQRRYSRRSVSPEKELWRRQSRERTSMDRASKYAKLSHVDDDSDDERKSSFSRRRYSGRSVSPEKDRWRRQSRERTSIDRESKYAKSSHVDDDSDDERKSPYSIHRYSGRSVSPEKDRWRRRSRERTSIDREFKYANPSHVDDDDNDDSKGSYYRSRNSRRSVSPEKGRWRRNSRESTSRERESEHAVRESRNQDTQRFRSPIPRMRRDLSSIRKQISEAPVSSWIHNIVVKIADPPRAPIRKRRNRNDRRFIQRNRVEERSSNATDEERRLPEPSSTREDRSEADAAQMKKKKRWTYNEYAKQSDGSLKRKREFSDDEEDHFAWKRYDDERTMPYQGYADSQVQSLLKQLCGDYVTQLYSRESNIGGKPSSKNALGSEQDLKDHRSWFMTSSEWISYGEEAYRPEDQTKQPFTTKDLSTKAAVSVLWHTVPLSTNTKKVNERGGKTKTEEANERENQAKTRKRLSFDQEKETGQTSLQEGSSTLNEKVASQASLIVNGDDILNSRSNNTHQQYQMAHSNMTEGTGISSSTLIPDKHCVGSSENFTSGSLQLGDLWNTSTSCNNPLETGQMTRNDLLVMVTPSSYWYEKQLLRKQKEEKPSKAKNTTGRHHQSLYIPTSCCSSRLTDVSSFSVCFHCDTSKFDFSPQMLDSSEVDEGNVKARNESVFEHTTTPQTGKTFMESECSIHTSAKRQLNFGSITEMHSSTDSKTDDIQGKKDLIETIKDDQETGTRTDDPLCSISTSEEEISSPVINSNPDNLPMSERSSSPGTNYNATGLQMLDDSIANKSAHLENINIKVKGSHQEKTGDHQLVEVEKADVHSETSENHSPITNLPQKKIQKSDRLGKEEKADVHSETSENQSLGTHFPQKKIEKKNRLGEREKADVHSEKSENHSPITNLPQKKMEKNRLGEEEKADVHSETNENQSLETYFPQKKIEKKNRLVEEENADVLSKTNKNHSPGTNLPQEKIENNNDHQLGENENADIQNSETNENHSPGTNLPTKKIEEKNQLGEEEKADFHLETGENRSSRTNLPTKKIEKNDGNSSSMLKCLVEEVEEVGEEMWELALKTTTNETSGDGDNAINIGSAFTKLHPKSGDLDVAVVKPSPRQKHRSALNESLETFAYQDENNVNMVNPAITTIHQTQQKQYDTTKTPVQNEQKIQFVSQIKVAKKLEHSKKPPNFTRCVPSSTSVVLSSTPHMKDPLPNIQKRPKEAKLNPLDGTTEALAVGRVIENFPQEKSAINLPLACSASSQQHGSPMRLFQAPPQSYQQDEFGYTFRTPNLQQNQQPQQQENEFNIIQSSFSNNNSIHMINNKHLSINTSSNAKVIPTLSNRQEIFPEQLQGGDLSKSLRNQAVFIRDSPMLENQQHAMMPKQAFRSVNDSYQGLLLRAQKNVSPSMPPLKNTFIGQGIDQGHAIHSLNFSTRTTEPVCFQPSEYQQQLTHQQEHIYHQQQQLQQKQQIHYRQQRYQLQQQQQLHPQPNQLQQHQQIHPQQQQQQLRQHQQIHPQQHQHQLRQHQQIHHQQQQQQKLQQEQQIHQQQEQQKIQQQQQQLSQQQLQQQRPILDELTTMTIHQEQTISAHLPRAYPIIERPPQLESWHDTFLSAPKIHDDLSHIPWGQHELDLGYQVDLRMRPQYPQTRTPLPQNAQEWFFNAQKNLSE